ncbi:MAG: hypothetical protein RBT19_09380 [Tenuifilaceae bacterium]|jgi:hypothetical protein|nr:hypothetical protein [Tenuifilaceae bacterium]
MKAASIHNIKTELKVLPQPVLVDICIRLAKYKLENKELLSYLLFEAQDEQAYIAQAKALMEEDFKSLNKSRQFLAKKTIRKALRTTTKHIKYSSSKQTELELLIHFCKQLRKTGLALRANTVIGNIYLKQYLKIKKTLESLHEDLQYDYNEDVRLLEK